MLERIYWRAGPEAVKIIEELCAERLAESHRRQALCDVVGAKCAVGTSSGIFSGVIFETDPDPRLWRKARRPCADGTEYWEPVLRSKEGRRIKTAMRDGRMPNGETLRKRFGFDGLSFVAPDGNVYLAMFNFEKFNDVFVIVTFVGDIAIPPGCTRIKNSEYWALKEACAGKGCG